MATEKTYIFDSCALIAFFQQEPGAEVVLEIFREAESRRLVHVINLCEVFYDMLRRSDEVRARRLEATLRGIGFEIEERSPAALWQRAGELKATLRRVSLADCFALALTMQEDGIFVTSDHHEIDRVAEMGYCSVRFIR